MQCITSSTLGLPPAFLLEAPFSHYFHSANHTDNKQRMRILELKDSYWAILSTSWGPYTFICCLVRPQWSSVPKAAENVTCSRSHCRTKARPGSWGSPDFTPGGRVHQEQFPNHSHLHGFGHILRPLYYHLVFIFFTSAQFVFKLLWNILSLLANQYHLPQIES